jgi:hypothetical protein
MRGVLREAYMDGLEFLFRLGGIYGGMHRPFSRWATAAGQKRVLDLASGSGGPVATMLTNAQACGIAMPSIVLSDLYPDATAFQSLQEKFPDHVSYVSGKVDAASAPHDAPLLSMCSAFHHFPPAQAAQVLAHATGNFDGIFVMEVFERNWLTPFLSLPMLPFLMFAAFFARRFSWRKVLVTALFPIVPLMIVLDGTVSALRTYRPEELTAMLPMAARNNWRWETGTARYMGLLRAQYFCGCRIQTIQTEDA